MSVKIPLFKPCLGDDELQAVKDVFESNWIGMGPTVSRFEEALASHQGVKHAVALNSCTAGLDLAVEALFAGCRQPCDVIVPTVTFVSTPHAVAYNGLKIVFCDVDDRLCMDPADLERRITPRTVGVMPVHVGGQACDMDAIMGICSRAGLQVIEDVANGQGGLYKGRRLGSIGSVGCLSFEAKKNMTTGDGGALVFDRIELLGRLRKMRWCGIDKDTWTRNRPGEAGKTWYYEVDCLGKKYNMNDIVAAIGLVQLSKLDDKNARKRKIIGSYIDSLRGVGDIHIPDYDLFGGAYWLFIIHTDRRDELFAHMASKGVTCGVHFIPCHLHPYYSGLSKKGDLPNSERLYRRIITLPLYATMTEDEQAYVIECVKEFFDHA